MLEDYPQYNTSDVLANDVEENKRRIEAIFGPRDAAALNAGFNNLVGAYQGATLGDAGKVQRYASLVEDFGRRHGESKPITDAQALCDSMGISLTAPAYETGPQFAPQFTPPGA